MWGFRLLFSILFFSLHLNYFVANAESDGHCVDTTHQIISQGLYYVPGPNPCNYCLCDKGSPKWCKPVYCKQPQNCKSFHTGDNCCDFVCLDDILKQNTNNTFKDNYKDSYDIALRLIASTVFIILTLTLLFFVIHRFRRHKMRVQQTRRLNEDRRSLNGIGYIAGSLGYLPGNIGYLGSGSRNELEFHYERSNAHYALWKPPDSYFPRGEAPPPYEEAVRSAQLETNFAQSSQNTNAGQSGQSSSSRSQLNSTPGPCRHQHLTNRTHAAQEYANVTIETVLIPQQPQERNRNVQAEAHPTGTGSAQPKIIKASDRPKGYENVNLGRKNDRPSTSTSTKSNQNHTSGRTPPQERSVKSYKYENVAFSKNANAAKGLLNTLRHLEITQRENEIYEIIEPCYENTSNRVPSSDHERAPPKASQYRNSVYVLAENGKDFNKFNSTDGQQENKMQCLVLTTDSRGLPLHRTLPKHLKEPTTSKSADKRLEADAYKHRSLPKQFRNQDTILSVNLIKSSHNVAQINDNCLLLDNKGVAAAGASACEMAKEDEDQRTFLSYQCLSSQDDDDYRSECENCKTAEMSGSNEDMDVFNETMTLQRRPEASEEVPYYRTSLTLPSQIKKSKVATSNNANREGWFMNMRETSSSDESD